MAVRAVWRPPWYAWALLWLAALVLVRELSPRRLEGHWLILAPVALLIAVFVVRRLWELSPAVNMCAAIVLSVFSGAWAQIGLGGLPLDRLLILVVLLQLLLRAPGAVHTPPLRIRNVHLLMALTVLYVSTSALVAGTLDSEAGFLSLVGELGITPYLLFFVAPSVFSTRHEREMLLATLVGLGAYLGLISIFESIGPHSLVFPRYIIQAQSAAIETRSAGPFQSTVAEGFATFACAVAATIAYVQWQQTGRRYIAAAVAAICLFGCFLTLERSVWIAAIVGILVAALARRSGRRMLVPAVALCAIALVAIVAISPALGSKVSTRTTDQGTVWARQNETSAGLRMLAARPLFGFGWDRYTSEDREYFHQSPDYPLVGYSVSLGPGSPATLLPLHDTYLAYAVELGVVGALLWLATLLWGLGATIFSRGSTALLSWKLGLLAITVFYLAVAAFNPYEQPFPVTLLWLWAGVVSAGAPEALERRSVRLAAHPAGELAWSPT